MQKLFKEIKVTKADSKVLMETG